MSTSRIILIPAVVPEIKMHRNKNIETNHAFCQKIKAVNFKLTSFSHVKIFRTVFVKRYTITRYIAVIIGNPNQNKTDTVRIH